MKTQKNRIKYQSQLQRRKAKWGYVFRIIISFTDSKLGSTTYIGLRNYGKILRDYAFWRSLLAMLAYVVIAVPVIVFVPLCAANALRRYGKKFNTAAKLLMYLPGVTCSVALILSWKYMFDPNVGMLRSVLGLFGVTKVSVFDSARTAIPIMSLLAACTNFGANLIIYCAALDAIPNDYYEAAELDGASKRRQFISITIPLLNPTIVYVFITATIGALQIFVIPQLMTGGGPNYSTSTLLMLVYNTAFTNNQFGYASAIGVILFLITAIIAIIQFRVTRRDAVEY